MAAFDTLPPSAFTCTSNTECRSAAKTNNPDALCDMELNACFVPSKNRESSKNSLVCEDLAYLGLSIHQPSEFLLEELAERQTCHVGRETTLHVFGAWSAATRFAPEHVSHCRGLDRVAYHGNPTDSYIGLISCSQRRHLVQL